MRHWNFAAGPATIPLAVLEQVREELPDWHGAGCGVMEMKFLKLTILRID